MLQNFTLSPRLWLLKLSLKSQYIGNNSNIILFQLSFMVVGLWCYLFCVKKKWWHRAADICLWLINVLSLLGPEPSVLQGPRNTLFVHSLIVDSPRNILSWYVTRDLLQNSEAITCTLEHMYYVNHFLLWNLKLRFHLWKAMLLSIFFTTFKKMTLIVGFLSKRQQDPIFYWFINFLWNTGAAGAVWNGQFDLWTIGSQLTQQHKIWSIFHN